MPVIWGHGLSMDRVSDGELGLIDWDRLPVSVVRYDARGHGESESTLDLDSYRWSELALDQLRLADALGIGRYVAAGASMGCGTALHAAAVDGVRVAGLVLVIPPTAWETRSAQADQWELAASVIERDGVEGFIAARAEVDPPDPYRGDDARQEEVAEAIRRWDPRRLATVMRGATRANLPDRHEIARIGVPTLILAWTGDPVHLMSTAEELARLLPQAELHRASTRSELDDWTDLAREFLSRVSL